MNNLIKYLLNFFDPETAHKLAVSFLSRNHFVSYRTKDLYTKIANLEFKNPIGLAAGFDKSGQCFHGIFKLGFSSVEVGTVTPFSQAGNNKPRVFRLYKNRAVINSYGFNNDGMEIVKNRLNDGKKREGVLGVNIGPNKKSKNPIEDFKVTSKNLSKYCDYITINISSPNTPGLRNMHDKNLLSEVIKATKEGISEVGSHKPIFLKISPDEKISTITEIINTSINENIDALVISNTTIERPVYLNSKYQYIKGGLSGNPLFKKSTKLLENIHKITNGKIDLVGVGGVESANQAYVKILVGAKLVQLYTGLLFQGPNIVKIITSQLCEFLKRDGFNSLEDAVGSLSYEEAAKLNNLEY